jgi:hypothetical protein
VFPFPVSQFTNENIVNNLKCDSFGVNCITIISTCPRAKKCAYLFIYLFIYLLVCLFVCFFISHDAGCIVFRVFFG